MRRGRPLDGLRPNRLSLDLVPLHRAAQAVFEVHQNFVSEVLLRLRDVGQGMLDVSSPLGAIFDSALIAGERFQSLKGFVQRDAATGGAVKDASGTSRRWG